MGPPNQMKLDYSRAVRRAGGTIDVREREKEVHSRWTISINMWEIES